MVFIICCEAQVNSRPTCVEVGAWGMAGRIAGVESKEPGFLESFCVLFF